MRRKWTKCSKFKAVWVVFDLAGEHPLVFFYRLSLIIQSLESLLTSYHRQNPIGVLGNFAFKNEPAINFRISVLVMAAECQLGRVLYGLLTLSFSPCPSQRAACSYCHIKELSQLWDAEHSKIPLISEGVVALGLSLD